MPSIHYAKKMAKVLEFELNNNYTLFDYKGRLSTTPQYKMSRQEFHSHLYNYPFPTFLRQKRKEHNLRVKDVAKLIGVCRQSVTEWECGRSLPRSTKHMESLAKLYDFDPGSFELSGQRLDIAKSLKTSIKAKHEFEETKLEKQVEVKKYKPKTMWDEVIYQETTQQTILARGQA
jgi:transcriptional regulator with XRE-family HTH domain